MVLYHLYILKKKVEEVKMSLSMCARIKDKCFNEEQFDNLLLRFFNHTSTEKNGDEKCVTYSGYYSQYGFIISFIEQKKEPYNIYDSDILDGEYIYNQVIIFDIDKNRDINTIYNTIFEFCCYIFKKVETEFLITSDSHGEICLIKSSENELIFFNNDFVNKEVFEKYHLISKFNKIGK
jgi:hypothetical protein